MSSPNSNVLSFPPKLIVEALLLSAVRDTPLPSSSVSLKLLRIS